MRLNMEKPVQIPSRHYIFVRHGESTDNVADLISGLRDPGLTDVGLAQARDAADWIATYTSVKGVNDISIVSSPLKRAFGTAAIIASRLNLPEDSIVETSLLQERARGTLEGTLRASYSEEQLLQHGAESITSIGHRVRLALGDLALIESEIIVIVSHRHFMRYLIQALTGKPVSPEELANARPIEVKAKQTL